MHRRKQQEILPFCKKVRTERAATAGRADRADEKAATGIVQESARERQRAKSSCMKCVRECAEGKSSAIGVLSLL